MPVDPRNVTGPANRLQNHHVLYEEQDWSLAVGLWDRDRPLLVRMAMLIIDWGDKQNYHPRFGFGLFRRP
jgi:hypothetical protein